MDPRRYGAICIALLVAAFTCAAVPTLDPATTVKDAGIDLDLGSASAPDVVDWNEDGRRDLLVGRLAQGSVTLYLNVGTDATPAFDGGEEIEASGTAITTAFGSGAGPSPRSIDWNGDGRKDLLLGEWNGSVRIYLNIGTDAAPLFGTYSLLAIGGAAFDFGSAAAIEPVDWNADGRNDILVGTDLGLVYLALNTGTNTNPIFSVATALESGAGTLDVGNRAAPVVVDWNTDGMKDLVVGNALGQLIYFENEGTDASPVLAGGTVLAAAAAIDVGSYARPEAIDWNGDGTRDLLVGSSEGTVAYFHAVAANNPPSMPSDPAPGDGQTGEEIDLDLGWTGGDPDGDAVTYDLFFGTTEIPALLGEDLTTATYAPEGLAFGTTYYWRVFATDDSGDVTAGPLWQFTTAAEEGNNAPHQPGQPSPADGATGRGTDLTLTWTGGDPDDADTVTYDLYLGTSNPPGLIALDVITTSYEVSGIAGGQVYYWKVVAIDSQSTTTAGDIWQFSTGAGAGDEGGGGCFIATAACGDDATLSVLRRVRDRRISPRELGAGFVATYYATSPAVADWLGIRAGLAAGIARALGAATE